MPQPIIEQEEEAPLELPEPRIAFVATDDEVAASAPVAAAAAPPPPPVVVPARAIELAVPVVRSVPQIKSKASTPNVDAKREVRQEQMQFEPVTRGRFEKSEPTIEEGQDLDVPTFLRKNVRVK